LSEAIDVTSSHIPIIPLLFLSFQVLFFIGCVGILTVAIFSLLPLAAMNVSQLFRHVLLIEDGKFSRIITLDPEKAAYSLGRDQNNDILLQNYLVSRCHATLLQQRNAEQPQEYFYRLVDGDGNGNPSKNGLLVNGQHCRSHDLQHGDVICFGSQTVKATYQVTGQSSFLKQRASEEPITGQVFTNQQPSYLKTYVGGEPLADRSLEDVHRLASFPELSPCPIMEIDLQGQITYLNPIARLKFPEIEAENLEHPALAGLLNQTYNEQGNVFKREVKVGAEVFEQYIHYLPESHCIRSYFFDITELNFRAAHDVLTRLANRRYFSEQLAISLSNAQRYEYPLAVMFLDLDNFKNINTTLGHGAGDSLLRGFAQRLNACVRQGDIVARWGGDEFILLLPHIQNDSDTVKLANRILDNLKQPFEVAGELLYIKTSIGIAIYPEDGQDAETLVRNADISLSRSKDDGGNCYCFYSSTMTAKASLLLRLENLLHQAMAEGQFSLHYQPQMRLRTGEVTGIEALLRCSHPELSQIPLTEFIALAEKTKLMNTITEWMLRQACQQNKIWQDAGLKPIPIAVNFSPHQFQQPDLIELVDCVLGETGLEPEWLEMEITETSILHDVNSARQSLQKLRQRGISLSMDDFGTGYSSLSYLHKFPFNTLKIDSSFIGALADNPQDTSIVAAAIALGRIFNLRVVAEGVETWQQLELLQRLDCEEIQGYWFSHPLPAAAATQFLAQQQLDLAAANGSKLAVGDNLVAPQKQSGRR
jgi:diguanylate cyclase (GGDEF)-like protein